MLRTGILNPQIASLIARVRHTNTLVIADRGFPFFPQLETIDLALVDDIPTVLHVLEALSPNFVARAVWMADEFFFENTADTVQKFENALAEYELTREPHNAFKHRVPSAVGLIRTGDTTQYANMILESA